MTNANTSPETNSNPGLPAAQARAAANAARAAYQLTQHIANDADVAREWAQEATNAVHWDRVVGQLNLALRGAIQLKAEVENALLAARAAHRLALEA